MRACPFDGCGRPIPPTMFACGRHWRCLNPAQQRAIYAAYADYQADRIDIDELRQLQQEVLDQVQAAKE